MTLRLDPNVYASLVLNIRMFPVSVSASVPTSSLFYLDGMETSRLVRVFYLVGAAGGYICAALGETGGIGVG